MFRYDSAAPLARCDSTGDPHIRTFDGLYYSIFSTGNFIYARNLSYVAVEVSFTYDVIRYDTIGEFNVDWKAEYSALSSTRSQKKKLKQPTPVPL